METVKDFLTFITDIYTKGYPIFVIGTYWLTQLLEGVFKEYQKEVNFKGYTTGFPRKKNRQRIRRGHPASFMLNLKMYDASLSAWLLVIQEKLSEYLNGTHTHH